MATLMKSAEVSVVVDADPADVWAVVSDPTRTGEWSEECYEVTWLDGATGPAVGARFLGRSRLGRARWKRVGEVVAFEAPRRIAWTNLRSPLHRDSTTWELVVEPDPGGCRITQRYTLDIGPICDRLFAAGARPHRDRRAGLVGDLRRIGAAARRRGSVEGTREELLTAGAAG